MSQEINFASLGIPEDQIKKLGLHFEKAQNFVFPKDPGMDQSILWLKSSIEKNLQPWAHSILEKILDENLPNPKVEYLENGYDSCQSHRKLSKVMAESILIGGLIYEYSLMGIKISVKESKSLIGSSLKIDDKDALNLSKIAQIYGANQDFIFPGVTPTDPETPSLQELAYLTLSGNPKTSVRSLTGVGGFRFDQDWNYVTDFATFVKLKIDEDKRYYPGIGIFYAMLQMDLNQIPTLVELQKSQPEAYKTIYGLSELLKNIPEKKFQGVSLLCSTYIPSWNELKKGFHRDSFPGLEIAGSFHSPSYDFYTLKGIFEDISKGKNIDSLHIKQINLLKVKLNNFWSFNSTVHLPWTSELAGLSNDLMSSISNHRGDYALRYGLGYKQKSLEIREYHLGENRNFSGNSKGNVFYRTFFYPESDSFEGQKIEFSNESNQVLFTETKEIGFMASGLKYLSEK